MGTATKIAGIVIGIIIILCGLMMPVLFAGQYLMLSLIVLIIGIVVIYLGIRSGRNKNQYSGRGDYEREITKDMTICQKYQKPNHLNAMYCSHCGNSLKRRTGVNLHSEKKRIMFLYCTLNNQFKNYTYFRSKIFLYIIFIFV